MKQKEVALYCGSTRGAFGAAVDDEEDDVIDKPLSVTLGCRPLVKKEPEK